MGKGAAHMARDPRKARILPQTAEAVQALYKHLAKDHGIDPIDASECLHEIKHENGYGAADNVALDWTGNVYNPEGVHDPATREWLGSITYRGTKRRRKR
jgi:hypothetical protein